MGSLISLFVKARRDMSDPNRPGASTDCKVQNANRKLQIEDRRGRTAEDEGRSEVRGQKSALSRKKRQREVTAEDEDDDDKEEDDFWRAFLP
jgi:hypothetical protein